MGVVLYRDPIGLGLFDGCNYVNGFDGVQNLVLDLDRVQVWFSGP